MSIAQLLENIFPSSIERDHFEYILKQCAGGETSRTWHWYGAGNNGKTTLMNALVKEYPIVRLPSDNESEEVFQLCNSTNIRIINVRPKCNDGDIITEFITVFN